MNRKAVEVPLKQHNQFGAKVENFLKCTVFNEIILLTRCEVMVKRLYRQYFLNNTIAATMIKAVKSKPEIA